MSTGELENSPPKRIPRFWSGYISGTNRGNLFISLDQHGEVWHGTAFVQDHEFGVTIVAFSGKLSGNQAELRLHDFWGSAPMMALYGELKLNFGQNFQSAEGSWQTDIGTQGTCKLWPADIGRSLSWLRVAGGKSQVFLRRCGATVYAVVLFIVALLSLSKIFEVSYPSLILLLVPTPYVFRKNLTELITAYRVRKVGPIEFETQNPLTEDIRRVISQQVQETVAFVALNGFFVIRTKLLLIWLSQNPPVDRVQFSAHGTTIGVPPENLDATWNALLASGCATLEGDKLSITDLGRRYVAYLTRQS